MKIIALILLGLSTAASLFWIACFWLVKIQDRHDSRRDDSWNSPLIFFLCALASLRLISSAAAVTVIPPTAVKTIALTWSVDAPAYPAIDSFVMISTSDSTLTNLSAWNVVTNLNFNLATNLAACGMAMSTNLGSNGPVLNFIWSNSVPVTGQQFYAVGASNPFWKGVFFSNVTNKPTVGLVNPLGILPGY